jgi:hypothetical protein
MELTLVNTCPVEDTVKLPLEVVDRTLTIFGGPAILPTPYLFRS